MGMSAAAPCGFALDLEQLLCCALASRASRCVFTVPYPDLQAASVQSERVSSVSHNTNLGNRARVSHIHGPRAGLASTGTLLDPFHPL